MRDSEYRANRELAETPKRRINRDYSAPAIAMSDVIKVLGWFALALLVIAFAQEIWECILQLKTAFRAVIEARSSAG